jgi:hypothetical protein
MEPPSIEAYSHEHCDLIGLLCNFWAEAEERIREFFINVSDMKPTRQAYVVARHLAVRDMIAASKSCVVMTWEEKALRNEAIDVLSYFDSVLRPERNRLVHDKWLDLRSTGLKRIEFTPRIRKPQAFQLVVEDRTFHDVSKVQIDNLIYDVRHQASYLIALMACRLEHPSFPLKETLSERPPRQFQPRR